MPLSQKSLSQKCRCLKVDTLMRPATRLRWPLSFNLIVAFIVILVTPGVARAAALNIDFGSQFSAPSGALGGAANNPGFWNNITSLGVTSGLKDLFGSTTGIAIDVVQRQLLLIASAAVAHHTHWTGRWCLRCLCVCAGEYQCQHGRLHRKRDPRNFVSRGVNAH